MHLKGFTCQLLRLATLNIYIFFVALKRLLLSAYFDWPFIISLSCCTLKKASVILLATLQCNYRNKAVRFGINCTPTIETNVWQTKSLSDYIHSSYFK